VFRRHLTLSILAHFQNGNQQKTSKTDDERVSKCQLQRPSPKKFVMLFCDYFCHTYKLYTSQRQPSTRTHRRFYYGCSQPGLQPDPGCAWNNSRNSSYLAMSYGNQKLLAELSHQRFHAWKKSTWKITLKTRQHQDIDRQGCRWWKQWGRRRTVNNGGRSAKPCTVEDGWRTMQFCIVVYCRVSKQAPVRTGPEYTVTFKKWRQIV